jgi:hypothetical protein
MKPNEIMALLCPSNNNSQYGRSDTLRVDVYGVVRCIPGNIYGRKHTLDRLRRVAVALWHLMESLPSKALTACVCALLPSPAVFCTTTSIVYVAVDLLAAGAALFATIYPFVVCFFVCTDRIMTNIKKLTSSFPTPPACW